MVGLIAVAAVVVSSQVTDVTVYNDRAQVVRTAEVMLEQGVNKLRFENLPEGVDLTEWYGLTEIPAVPIVDMTETNVMMMTTGEPSNEPNVIDKLKTGYTHVPGASKDKEKK